MTYTGAVYTGSPYPDQFPRQTLQDVSVRLLDHLQNKGIHQLDPQHPEGGLAKEVHLWGRNIAQRYVTIDEAVALVLPFAFR